MKTLFHLKGEQPRGNHVLLLELGADFCSYALLDNPSKAIFALKYSLGAELDIESTLAATLEELKEYHFSSVIVSVVFPHAVLTPFQYSLDPPALTKILYNLPGQRYLTDAISEWQIMNAYALPQKLYDMIVGDYPAARFMHSFSSALKIYNGFSAEDQLTVHFNTQHFQVLVKKGTQLVLAQIYLYKTPLDVVYYLLKICSGMELSQGEVFLILSGLVDEDSAVYKELHQYFLNIHFAQAPAVTLPDNEYPQHYFTSLHNLAACVS